MKLASKPVPEMTTEEKIAFDEYKKEAKKLDALPRLHVPTTFCDDLENALEEIGAFFPDRQKGGVVSREIIKAKYEADYIIAYRFCKGKSTLVYSSDADLIALCGPKCLSIQSFDGHKRKRKNDNDEEG